MLMTCEHCVFLGKLMETVLNVLSITTIPGIEVARAGVFASVRTQLTPPYKKLRCAPLPAR